MTFEVDIQSEVSGEYVPPEDFLRNWAAAALRAAGGSGELTLRIVDEEEMTELNSAYRGKPAPTNVLAFPFPPVPGADSHLLGDVVIAAPVVNREAGEQHKPADAHWAHMVVHGVLHLLGYDHQADSQAAEMESRETDILASLGYPDPYLV